MHSARVLLLLTIYYVDLYLSFMLRFMKLINTDYKQLGTCLLKSIVVGVHIIMYILQFRYKPLFQHVRFKENY